jgi:16S rRNA G966 N2-methylase RsmD
MLLPDNCIYVIINNTLFIIEVKTQHIGGSVDEKLQTCDFKKKQYIKLLSQLNVEVEYIYILDDWFRHEKYKDVLDYIISVRCQYYFNYIPLSKLGLPVPRIMKAYFKSEDKDFTLLHGDCVTLLNEFHFQFDMIFADPPYFLSNGGISVQSGKMVSVNKGDWGPFARIRKG